MSTVVQLFIMKNGALEGTELVSGDRFVVGTDASCACVLDDASVQPRHLGVFVHDGKLAIQDLTGGQTKVNGESFTGARYVGPREDVVLGVYTIKLKLMSGAGKNSGPQPTSPPAAASTPPQAAPQASPAAAKAPLPASPKSPAPTPSMKPSPSPSPSPSPVAARGQGVVVGAADLETTMPGVPPPPPATDPPLGGMSTDDEHTAVDPPRARQTSLAPQPGLAVAQASAPMPPMTVPEEPAPSKKSSKPKDDVAVGPALPALAFAPAIGDDDDDHDHDDAAPWSLVQRLVRPPEGATGKNAVIEVVHHRGEHIIDHRVLREGETFALGAAWSKDERRERGLDKPLPLVRLKKDGVAELLQAPGVQGKLLRQGAPSDLPQNGAPLVDGELASLKWNNERVFVRFAGVPKLVWSKEELAQANRERTIQILSGGASVAFLAFFVLLSWIYSYRSKDEDIIELEDDGFAEIVEKDLNFEEPPKPEKPPEPVKTKEPAPTPEKQEKPTPQPTTKAEATPEPAPKEAPKAGLAAALENIPKVNDSASAQNLNAALSNIKGVRVPGEASGFKTSALTGKGPSSGVQIGGTTGVATSGINALIRKDGAAGAMTGKGDRAITGKVTTQPRLSQVKGTGELSKDEIQRVINSHVGEIQYCYEKQLRTNSGLAGRVVLEWVVGPAGAVTGVKLSTSSLSSTDATNCMMASVKKWKFPKPRGNGAVTVVYPFVFNTI